MSTTIVMQNLSAALLNDTANGNQTSPAERSHSVAFYISLCVIWIPGFLMNLLALMFIIRDMKKTIFPALILLLVLCVTDLTAVCLSFTRYMIAMYVQSVTYSMCVPLSILPISFKLYSGLMNTLMAIDRVMALCMPFYYKRYVVTRTWARLCLIAVLATACLNCLPLVGLGDYMGTRSTGAIICNSLDYKANPIERVFGITYGILGLLIVFAIVILNCIVIRTVLKLNKRIVSITSSEITNTTGTDGGTTSKSRGTSFEIAFAKLMGALATVYLVCVAPSSVHVLLQQFNYKIDGSLTGYIYLLGAFNYCVDPIVYILIRKTSRKKIAELFCVCKRGSRHVAQTAVQPY